jgi:hypothetical protein
LPTAVLPVLEPQQPQPQPPCHVTTPIDPSSFTKSPCHRVYCMPHACCGLGLCKPSVEAYSVVFRVISVTVVSTARLCHTQHLSKTDPRLFPSCREMHTDIESLDCMAIGP